MISHLRPTWALALAVLAPLETGALPQAASTSPPICVDYDGDGRNDLALLDELGNLRLHRNEAQGFREVTGEAGLARLGHVRLARWADFDRDGRADLLVARAANALELLRCTGGTFEAVDAGLATEGIVAAEWLDADGDGWSDLWLRGADGWKLLRNEHGRSFEPMAAGEAAPLGIAVASGAATDPAAEDDAARAPAADKGPHPSSEPRETGSSIARATTASPPTLPAAPPPGPYAATFMAPCARTLFDVATGDCMSASSAPSLGKLYPLSTTLNVGATGNVGIGALFPTHRLTVTAPSDDALRLIGPGLTYGYGARLNFGDGDFVYIYEDADDSLEIHTSVRTAFTGGKVGIGTTSPSWPLHVAGAQAVGRFDSTNSTFGSVIELRNLTTSPTDVGAINFVNSLGQFKGQIAYTGNDALTFDVNATERMRIDAAGNVGIGASPSTSRLSVVGSSAAPIVAISQNASNGVEALDVLTFGSGHAIVGYHASFGGGDAVRGVTNGTGYGIFSQGNFGGTGAKYFVQPHPRDPSKEVRFVCLEGNESGTYFRGTATLAGGGAEIDVPEEFRLVSESDGLTVQVTPLADARLWVEHKSLDRIVVRGSADVQFDYFVNGVRRGFADLECVRENHAYVPEERGVPYGTQYPEALRKILVENGTLNPDFTPNEATAASLGWELAEPRDPR